MTSSAGRYKTISADPPWHEAGGGKIRRGANRHYSLMKTRDIAAMPVQRLAHPDGCHLWLWVTNNYLRDGLAVMEAWGFRYVTNVVWVKKRNEKIQRGLGQYIRGSHELLLFGVRGRLPYARDVVTGKRAQPASAFETPDPRDPTLPDGGAFYAPRGVHSAKPLEARAIMEMVSPGPRAELFARTELETWDCWGSWSDARDPLVDVLGVPGR